LSSSSISYEIDELDNVFYGIKRITTKKKTLLFYGIVWKQDYKREMEFDEDQTIYDLPLDVTEYRFSNKVKFNLINIPKTTQLTPSDNLVIENAAIQYPNTHIIELIARRNDHWVSNRQIKKWITIGNSEDEGE